MNQSCTKRSPCSLADSLPSQPPTSFEPKDRPPSAIWSKYHVRPRRPAPACRQDCLLFGHAQDKWPPLDLKRKKEAITSRFQTPLLYLRYWYPDQVQRSGAQPHLGQISAGNFWDNFMIYNVFSLRPVWFTFFEKWNSLAPDLKLYGSIPVQYPNPIEKPVFKKK